MAQMVGPGSASGRVIQRGLSPNSAVSSAWLKVSRLLRQQPGRWSGGAGQALGQDANRSRSVVTSRGLS